MVENISLQGTKTSIVDLSTKKCKYDLSSEYMGKVSTLQCGMSVRLLLGEKNIC